MKSRWPTFFIVFVVPFIYLVGCFKFYNKAEPFILGFPFILAWVFIGFGFFSLCIFLGWMIDPATERNRKKQRLLNAKRGN